MCKIGTFHRNLSTLFMKVLNIYLFSKIFEKVEIVMLQWNIGNIPDIFLQYSVLCEEHACGMNFQNWTSSLQFSRKLIGWNFMALGVCIITFPAKSENQRVFRILPNRIKISKNSTIRKVLRTLILHINNSKKLLTN